MPTRTAKPGDLILDAAGFVSLAAVRNAVAHPAVAGLSLYNGGRYGCTIEQVKIVVDAGKLVGPNWERRANEAMFGSGAWAVDSARAGVEKWGIDPSLVPTILSGVDFSTTRDQWPQVDYWHETACDRADETDTWIGFYGETKYGEHLIRQPWWQRTGKRPTWTWGGSGEITDTNMKQHVGFPSGNDYSSIGVVVDESTVRAGLAMVAAEGDPDDKDQDMGALFTLFNCTDDAAVFYGLFDGHEIQCVEWVNEEAAAHYRADKVPEVPSHRGGFVRATLLGAMPPGWDRSLFRLVLDGAGAGPVDVGAVAAAVRNDIKSRL